MSEFVAVAVPEVATLVMLFVVAVAEFVLMLVKGFPSFFVQENAPIINTRTKNIFISITLFFIITKINFTSSEL